MSVSHSQVASHSLVVNRDRTTHDATICLFDVTLSPVTRSVLTASFTGLNECVFFGLLIVDNINVLETVD